MTENAPALTGCLTGWDQALEILEMRFMRLIAAHISPRNVEMVLAIAASIV